MLCGAALTSEAAAVIHPMVTVLAAIAVLVIGAAVLTLLWNSVIPFVLVGWPEISFWQAIALQLLISLLFRRKH